MIPNIEVTEACQILGRCRKTVLAWMKSGKLQAVKVGGRYRTRQEWIEAMAVPVAIPRPDLQSEDVEDGDAILAELRARFGIKVPRPELRKNRRARNVAAEDAAPKYMIFNGQKIRLGSKHHREV